MPRETVTQQRDRFKVRVEELEGQLEDKQREYDQLDRRFAVVCRGLELGIEAVDLFDRLQKNTEELRTLALEAIEEKSSGC